MLPAGYPQYISQRKQLLSKNLKRPPPGEPVKKKQRNSKGRAAHYEIPVVP